MEEHIDWKVVYRLDDHTHCIKDRVDLDGETTNYSQGIAEVCVGIVHGLNERGHWMPEIAAAFVCGMDEDDGALTTSDDENVKKMLEGAVAYLTSKRKEENGHKI